MKTLRLKKGEERRIQHGHPWVYSNEIDTKASPLKSFTPGETVVIEAYNKRLLGSAYINPHSLITARLYSLEPSVHLSTDFFIQKIQSALDLRSKLFSKPYYRLIFSESDGLPGLVIDRFNQDFVIQINTAGMEKAKSAISEALLAVIPAARSILLRNDSQIREYEGLSQYIEPLYGEPPETITLEENGVHFTAPLLTGQKTGWFYDHRLNRARLKDYVQNQTVLDVFSYLGAFGIQAATFGAKQVDCIESSKSASEFIVNNAELNQVSHTLSVITDDAFDAMKSLLKNKRSFDVVVLDPPAFVKRIKDKKEGLVAYQRLNELAMNLLNPGGILVSCSCSMHISMQDLIDLIKRSAHNTKHTARILERGHQGPDHPLHPAIPETDYLKAIFVELTKTI